MSDLGWPVEDLVPHSGTMSLLDEALFADEERARAGVLIGEDTLLYDREIGGVPAWAGLEYMAQTIALYAGVQARKAGEPPAVGFLLGTRRFLAHVPRYKLGERLEIAVVQELRNDQMASFECQITASQELVAEARLSVFQPDNIAEFLGAAE